MQNLHKIEAYNPPLMLRPEKAPRQLPMVSFAVQNSKVLYPNYMSFVEGGALFIPSSREHCLGEKWRVLLRLIDKQTTFEIQGKVIWVTPKRAQGNRVPGFGLAFQGETAKPLQDTLQQYLGGEFNSDKPTHTL